MVLGDPEGSQGECWRAHRIVQKEQSTKYTWVLLGDGDEHHRFRARDICTGS
jgi:hypothetical protein